MQTISPSTPQQVCLKDYQPPAYWVDTVDLVVELFAQETLVRATLTCRKNDRFSRDPVPLVLYGEALTLQSLQLEGHVLAPTAYTLMEDRLTLPQVPETFTLYIETLLHPHKNTALSGLYQSGNLFCTQCEPEGFRRITYYPDRSDVMAQFTTTIYADKRAYPVLLSNGNLVKSGSVDADRHWATWQDPFKKPSYLFAMVAGDLMAVEDHFVTCSGRLVTLKLYVEPENIDKCAHALSALKKAMRWDEETYGREYDLDIYMIVAVNDFNMGAMENKGLNIFNAKYILARPETATDDDFDAIDAVVGHEYFHNWSGNRVTCRDWFQLSLKEGLTVFREQHFSLDISESPVRRIEDGRALRTHQFSEDAGPLAHPVRPESYMEINNFYTMTVYEKGAELIRMLKTLLGWTVFRQGMDLYFERHDGQAVTTEEFVSAMEAVSKRNLSQFRLWYTQAGTPEITAEGAYSAETHTYTLTLKQLCPPTPGQPEKCPMHIPVAVGLLDPAGQDMIPTQILELTEQTQRFHFSHIATAPVVSLLRDFSAPVTVHAALSDKELAFLFAHDSDAWNRWDAGQQLSERVLLRLIDAVQKGHVLTVDPLWLEAYQSVLTHTDLSLALKTELLTLPSFSYLLSRMRLIDVEAAYAARSFLKKQFVKSVQTTLLSTYYSEDTPGRYIYTPDAVAQRGLKNLCLLYFSALQSQASIDLCMQQWARADNMTDQWAVLSALTHIECPERIQVLSEFYDRWHHDPVVVNKWLAVQAYSELPYTLAKVKELMQHPAFSMANPNKVYALIGGFTSGNPLRFHAAEGEGYAFLAECVMALDPMNPQVAARMVRAFIRDQKLDSVRLQKIRGCLESIHGLPGLSKDVYEIVVKGLEGLSLSGGRG